MSAVVYNGKFPYTHTNYKGWDGTYNIEIMDTLPTEDILRKNLRPKQLLDRTFAAYVQPIRMEDVWYRRTFTFSFNGECKNDNPVINIVTLHNDGINPKTNRGLLTEEEYTKYKQGEGKIQEELEKQEQEDLELRKRLHEENRKQKECYKQRNEEYKYNTLYGELNFSFNGNIKHIIDPDKKIFAIECIDRNEPLTRLGMELDQILNTTYASNNSWRGEFNVCIPDLNEYSVRMITNKVSQYIHITFDLTKEVRDSVPVITCKDYYIGERSSFLMILDLNNQITQLQETVAKLTTPPEPSGFNAFVNKLCRKFR